MEARGAQAALPLWRALRVPVPSEAAFLWETPRMSEFAGLVFSGAPFLQNGTLAWGTWPRFW